MLAWELRVDGWAEWQQWMSPPPPVPFFGIRTSARHPDFYADLARQHPPDNPCDYGGVYCFPFSFRWVRRRPPRRSVRSWLPQQA